MDGKPIEFRQLCALVRSIIQQDPRITDAEWKARTMDTLAKWGFANPDDPQLIGRAMTQVEFAVRKTLGPRPMEPLRASPEPPPPPEYLKERRTNNPLGWDIVQKLMGRLQQDVRAFARSSGVAPPPRERLPVAEETALSEFWQAANAHGADRLALLCAFAEIAVIRPAKWDTKDVRDEATESGSAGHGQCFACLREMPLVKHHIVQIQHGGSNYLRNVVKICDGCHCVIHPWIAGFRTPPSRGWSSLSELAGCLQMPERDRA